MEAKKQKKKKRIAMYVIGSLALAAGAVVVMPKVIDYLSESYYKPTQPTPSDDDWGPEIVKIEHSEDADPSSEEDSDGKL